MCVLANVALSHWELILYLFFFVFHSIIVRLLGLNTLTLTRIYLGNTRLKGYYEINLNILQE